MKEFIPYSQKAAARYERELPNYEPFNHTPVTSRYEKVGDSRYISVAKGSDSQEIVISCVGDLLCERMLCNAHLRNGRYSFHDMYTFVRPYFHAADLSIANLETTVCTASPYTGEQHKEGGKYYINAPVQFLDAVKDAGFDFLTMANNHNLDGGFNGVMETLHHVDEREFMHTGLFRPEDTKRYTVVEVKGIRLGILGYSTWYNSKEKRFTDLGREQILNAYTKEKAQRDIAVARADGAEYIIVCMHWGIDSEYKSQPGPASRRMAQELADAGADYIVGSHTHSLQPSEMILSATGKVVPCAYSLGNFVTSETLTTLSHETAILTIRLQRENGKIKCTKSEFTYCYVPNEWEGIAYPVVPEKYILAAQKRSEDEMKLLDSIKEHISHAKSILEEADETIGKTYLTANYVRSLVGLPPEEKNPKFTAIRFAEDAQPGCLALVSAITSNPEFVTPPTRCCELADLAMKKGAKMLLAREKMLDYPTIVVKDPFQAYTTVITNLRSHVSPKAVSITGSIGKTTTTQMVATLFEGYFKTHRSTGSGNNVRYSGNVVNNLRHSHEMYVQELMEGPPYGGAATISKMVLPQASIVTVVGTSHMEHFGSQQRILETCLGVQEGMPEDGLLILNGDDPFQWNAGELIQRKCVYYGIENEKVDYRAVNIKGKGDCLTFDVLHDGTSTPVKIHCFGLHNVLDALPAFAAGKWAGLSDSQIATGLARYRTSGIRQNLVNYGGRRLYLDCYNSSPESVRSALGAFSMVELPQGGRRIAVLADVMEVGGYEEQFHRDIGRVVADSCVDMLICYGNDSQFIAEEVRAVKKIPIFETSSANELIALLKEHVHESDLTMFKGSHGMELEHIVDLVWGTWFHEEFERNDYKNHLAADTDLRYNVYTDHAVVINKRSTVADVVIPAQVDGQPVTAIASSVFSGSKYTKSVTFPDTLISIRYCSFYKVSGLEEIHLPSSLRILDASAFSTCENLKKVTIEPGCTHMGYRAFGNCKNLKSITIPATVRQIGNEAFLNDSKLTIYGEKDSYAEQYAKQRKIPFVATEIAKA